MAIVLTCPSCTAKLEYSDADGGRGADCPICRGPVDVPADTQVCDQCERRSDSSLKSCPACGRDFEWVDEDIVGPPEPICVLESIECARTSRRALWSLFLGVGSVLTFGLSGLPAVVLGSLAYRDIRAARGRLSGHGYATAGILTGGLASFVLIPLVLVLVRPTLQAIRAASLRTQCLENLRQIGQALDRYHMEFNCFPPAATLDSSGRALLSWRVLLLPYLDQSELYEEFHLDEAWDGPHNAALAARIPAVYRCGSDLAAGADQTAYLAVTGEGTAFPPNRTVSRSVIPGAQGYIAIVGEFAADPVTWTKPADVTWDRNDPTLVLWSEHDFGGNVLMLDGTARFIREHIDPVYYEIHPPGGWDVPLP